MSKLPDFEGLAMFAKVAEERSFAAAARAMGLSVANAAVAALGGSATGVRADASSLQELDRLFARVREEKGRIDVLFANAGGGSMLPLGAITEEQFDDTFGRNVKGVLFTVQKALPLLAEGASVILTGSTAGTEGTQAFSVYAASKAAVRSFARNWILDLKDRSIRINVLSPDAAQRQGLLDMLASKIPMGRVGEADEIAKAAVFLASDDSSFVNGAELFADGGQAHV